MGDRVPEHRCVYQGFGLQKLLSGLVVVNLDIVNLNAIHDPFVPFRAKVDVHGCSYFNVSTNLILTKWRCALPGRV
jgi:hypothetical protein